MKTFRFLAILALFLLPSSIAVAQIEQGRLLGTAADAQGGVLPGVTVTVTSPALIGERTAITEGDGRYLVQGLPGGMYTVRFELAGFQTFERSGIRVTQGSTLTVDAQLQLATLQETVTVSGVSPVVDTTTTKVGAEFNSEKLFAIPTATDVWAVMGQTPGIRMRGFDVGGSHKSQQYGYEAFGIRGQSRGIIEGIDLTEGTGGHTTYNDFYAIDEVLVTAIGGDVEMSTPGAAFVLSYKSGGNKFSGLQHLTYGPGRLVGDNRDEALTKRGFTGNPNLLFWEGHTDLGGPIIRDKLWFFAAYNYFRIDKRISGIDPNVATDLATISDPMLKITYKFGKKDTIIGFYEPRNHKSKPNRGLSASLSPDSVLAQASDGWIKKLQWQRTWTNRLFMDIRGAACCANWPATSPVDAAVKPPRTDTGTQLTTGAGWTAFTFGIRKPQFAGTFTYFLPAKAGTHDIKFGYDFIENRYRQGINGQTGPIQYLDRNGQVDEIQLRDTGLYSEFDKTWKPSWTVTRMFALFAQDRWAPTNRLTFTAGVRVGYQRPGYEKGNRNPVLKDIFPALTTDGGVYFSRWNYAPRVGVVIDLFGNGKTALKAFYGRYYANYAYDMDSANPGGVNQRTFKFLDPNGNRLYDGAHELGTLVAASGGASTRVDPNMKQPYGDEISASVQHQFWGEASVYLIYAHKRARNINGLVDVAKLGNITVPVNIANPFDTSQTIHALDVPASLRGVVRNTFMTVPGGDADYDTIALSTEKRFGRGVFLQGSIDYNWRDELRQPNTISTDPLTDQPVGVYSFSGGFPLEYSADVGSRQPNRSWQARLLGRYELPYGIALGANLRVQSGFPWAPVASIRLPNAGTQRVFLTDLDRRSQTVKILDLRLDKSFQIHGAKITALVDVFNSLNSNAVTNFFIVSGASFNRVIAALDPRTVHLGIRLSF
ncbi:MAG: TonB-dependent receptor [Acidobacteria bacterium]|nr:TonB-dependent receptor [Acidobacteriota bacterium]